MPIFTENDFTTGPRFLDELPVDLSTTLRTRYGFSRHLSAGSGLMRMIELEELERIETPEPRPIGRGRISEPETVIRTPISVDEANLQGEPFGLQFEHDTTQEALDEIIRRKREEILSTSILASAPKGFLPFVLGLGADMAGQMRDPLSFALSLIPIFKGTSFAASVTKSLGPRAARVALGGAEAGIANLAVEPFVLAAARQEHSDYTVINSLMNIAFGAGMGASFRTFGGELSSFVQKRKRYQIARREAEFIVDAQERLTEQVGTAEETRLMLMFDEAKKLEAEGRFAEAGELFKQIAGDVEGLPSAERDVLVRRVMEERLPDDLRNPTNSERIRGLNSVTHETALRMAMAQTMDGRYINVLPVLERDPGYIQPFLSPQDKIALADRKVEDLHALLKDLQGYTDDITQKEGVKITFDEEARLTKRKVDLEDEAAVQNELTDREAILDASIRAAKEEFDQDVLPGIDKAPDEDGGPVAIDTQLKELRENASKASLIAEGIKRIAKDCFGAS